MIRETCVLWREEHRFHKPPLAFNKRPTYEVHPRPRPIAEEGDRNTLQRREKEIVQTGERKTRRAREGEELKKQIEMHLRV